ncbi:UDP-Glycosyltransferase/glycogen phosphorylase [Neoconidiobolus thromboides FSU 785]|nr:UDP-Glycosyltransferase/glycogen phosphorylase [Neoconidiobolus thromboides FSU 785]
MNIFTLILSLFLSNFGNASIEKQGLPNHKLNIVLHSSFGGRSHIKSLLEIGDVLAKRGHSITYATIHDNIRFTSGYNIKNYTLGSTETDTEMEKLLRAKVKQMIAQSPSELNPKYLAKSLGSFFSKYYEDTFLPLKEYLIETKPDLVVCSFFAISCIDLAKHLKLPLIIGYQSTDNLGLIVEPFITMSSDYAPIYTKDMSFIERFNAQILQPAIKIYYFSSMGDVTNQLRKKYQIPIVNGMNPGANYGLNIANSFVGFEPATNTLPDLVHVGPIVSENRDKLTPELSEFLDFHENTLFIAFGSHSILNENITQKILEACLLAIEENIIDGIVWGLGKTKQNDFPIEIKDRKGKKIKVQDLFEGKNKNIRLLSWAPQVSVLNHKNTKLFISHGGLESTFEAIYSGTPILCLALIADQPRNARKIEEIGTGLYVDKVTFTPQSLKEQFKTIIEDKDHKFQSNLLRMKTISYYNSKRINVAVDLFEQHAYTAKACRELEPYNPNSDLPPCEIKHLVPVSQQMSFISGKGIDIYGALILLLLSSLILSFYSIYCLSKIGFKCYNNISKKFKME